MIRYIIVLIVAFLAVGGCGGGGGNDEECDFDFDSFLNGPNATEATTAWDCEDQFAFFAFQAFEDGTGFSTGVGAFTFQRAGCRRAVFQSGSGNGEIKNLEGSIDSGILTYEQVSDNPNLNTGPAACILVDL